MTQARQQTLHLLIKDFQNTSVQKDDCLRALAATDWDKLKAKEILNGMHDWRVRYCPEQVTAEDCPNTLAMKAFIPGGFSRNGFPLLECWLSRWTPSSYDFEEHHRFIAFIFGRSLRRGIASDRFALIFDMSGWNPLRHTTPHAIRITISVVRLIHVEFCERLGIILCVNTPIAFQVVWRIIEPLMEPRIRERIHLLGRNWRSVVAEHVDEDNLPQQLGGKSPERSWEQY